MELKRVFKSNLDKVKKCSENIALTKNIQKMAKKTFLIPSIDFNEGKLQKDLYMEIKKQLEIQMSRGL